MRRSLTLRLLILSLAASTLPALVVALIYQSISSRALQRSIQQQQTELARRVAENVNEEIRMAQRLTTFAATSPSLARGRLVEQQRILLQLIRTLPSLQEVMLVNADGLEKAKVSPLGIESRLIRRTENLSTSSIGDAFFSGNRLPTIVITEPLTSRKRQGALLAKLSFSSLVTLIQQTRIGERGNAFIVDQHGALLADPDLERVRNHVNVAGLPVVARWLTQPLEPTDLLQYTPAGGVPMMALAFPIPLLKSAVVVQQPKADVYALLMHMRKQFLGWTLVWVFIFGGLAALVAWRILKPLHALSQAAEQIGQGRWDVQLKIRTGDELEDLANAFSKMASSLKKLEGMRRDLMHMIVHDLKNPLSTVMGSLDYLASGEVGALTPEQNKFLFLARQSGQDLMMLIQNILDLARLEDGKLVLQKERFNAEDWALHALAPFRIQAEAGERRLDLRVLSRVGAVEGDRALLGRVLGNLVSNALHHTVAGTGEITIQLYPQGHQVAVAVADNGDGIAPEQQTVIFEKFVQGEVGRRRVTGSGLGLAFCKMVVEAHGGRIFVQSAPGQGSTFTFLLPQIPDSVDAEPEPQTAGRSVEALSND